jgi:hypothetical protein
MPNNVAIVPPDQTSQPIAPSNRPAKGLKDESYLVYPRDMADDQDRIKFVALQYPKQSLGELPNFSNLDILKEPSSKKSDYTPVPGEPYVYLPIQAGISDTNGVEWGGAELNAIQKYFANLSVNIMNEGGNAVETALAKAMNEIYANKGGIFGQLTNAGKLALAEMATGTQGLLSRATGNVLNPNLELLFRGPTLRPFQFQFKLSPRSKKESESVKKIIRFFKKNMAVQRNNDIFLKAPYIFGIEYQKGTSSLHASIGQIKPCALQAFNVDYTPLGSYMTYNDDRTTMVAYNLSLTFQEIIPIYNTDYSDTKYNDIGY